MSTVAALVFLLGQNPAQAQATTAPFSGETPQLVVQQGHSAEVACIAVSKDNRFVLTGAEDAVMWEAATGREVRRFQGHMGKVTSVSFSPDGLTVLTGTGGAEGDNTARLFDIKTGSELRRFQGHTASIESAFFALGGRFILTKSQDNDIRLWDTATGQHLKQLNVKTYLYYIYDIRVWADDRFALISASTGTLLWDIEKWGIARRFSFVSGKSITFSPDGRFILLPSLVRGRKYINAELIDANTGKEVESFSDLYYSSVFRDRVFFRDSSDTIHFAAISPDGKKILAATGSGIYIFDAATGKFEKFYKDWDVASAIFFSDNRSVVSIGSRGTPEIRDLESGEIIHRLQGDVSAGGSIMFAKGKDLALLGENLWDTKTWRVINDAVDVAGRNPLILSENGQLVLTAFDNATRPNMWEVHDAATGERMSSLNSLGLYNLPIAFSPDGRFLLTATRALDGDPPMRLWDAYTGKEVRQFKGIHMGRIHQAVFSPDGKSILTGNVDETASLWDVATGQETKSFKMTRAIVELKGRDPWVKTLEPAKVQAVSFSPDSKFILTSSGVLLETSVIVKRIVRLWSVETGKEVQTFGGYFGTITTLAFSADGNHILTGSYDKIVRLWDRATGQEIRRFAGHQNSIKAVAFAPNDKFIVTSSEDGTTRFWDKETGRELCKLISFSNGTWVVVDSQSHFDTNNFEGIHGLYWIRPDDPWVLLPIEIFARDYYEPRLLERLIAGEKIRPVRNLSELDREQPKVKITNLSLQPGTTDRLTVAVEVSTRRQEDKFVLRQDGSYDLQLIPEIYDLHLLRDGQLVGYVDGEIKIDLGGNKATVTFANIQLPRRPDLRQVEFSAYAFNKDRVKSATDRKIFSLPRLRPRKGNVYLVLVGVNAYENEKFDLSFAANDVRQMQKTLVEKLAQLNQYEKIVPIPLISDYKLESDKRIITRNTATKAHIKAVFDLLGGKKPEFPALIEIPNVSKIRPAKPEDMVLIFFSSHCYANPDGNFYVVPYDMGTSDEVTEEMLHRCISSEDLSFWLRDIDSGTLVMIVDACHSAAAIEGKEFKPASIGNRGLGQIAYDKGMMILAATQSDNVALEYRQIAQGLLTYALTVEAIGIERKSDLRPKDGKVTLTEWLSYGVERVPLLYKIARQINRKRLVQPSGKDEDHIQQPAFFDFTKYRKNDLIIIPLSMTADSVPPSDIRKATGKTKPIKNLRSKK